MIGPEEGHFALALACVVALAQFVLPLYGASRHDRRLLALAPLLAVSQFIALALSFFCLVWSATHDDFSVQNVADNSAIAKPLLYKITGTWGNHEGSILLWTLILGLCGAAVALFGRGLPAILRARVIAILGGVSAGFQLFCLLTSDPFARVWPAPTDGRGMNPLLQDPGLAFHPPILYTGYVGFAVPFAFAVAALIEGRVDAAWARWVRPWAVAAWSFLTCGIALGSWWSYYVLGWGGYWFWDPVENASLIPWLTGTALVHSSIVVEKREALKIWTVLLAIATFSFSLSGTFLVRSGILNSVHAFANDPARGVFILGLLAVVIGGSLLLFAWRAPALVSGGLFAPFSREGALVLNNILLCSICAVVLTGTMYPPFMQLLFNRTISVGKPFFDAATIPLTIPLLAAMALGTMLPWKRAHARPVLRRLRLAAACAVIALGVACWTLSGLMPILCAVGAVWVIAASLTDLAGRLGLSHFNAAHTLARARSLPRSAFGATLAHIGAGVTVLGLCGMAQAQHAIVEVRPGHTETLGGYQWTLLGVHEAKGPNYTSLIADIAVRRHGRLVTVMHPSKRDFAAQSQTTTEVSIRTNLLWDLYSVIGDRHGAGSAATYVLRLHVNPLAPWMWLGGLIMAIGGFLSLSDRRLRVGAARRTAQVRGVAAE
ncbi:heme lyase CcmF/NrfE family subunit [Acidomonas methanolica]|uniref:Cytochrome c biogenesis protein CysK/CcmF n=3 Tax=Acidomonas methanolica TaxID=437 RepID=A0A023D1R3_ACIMT|nr:heme lyase CcmF/NrfE family subunit [Acidomonas methanolica]TCS27425.1 cytochrome c-type biogenesis protein CcmF [Acidomonas methanolica]GAJ28093.1 cytochrome c biogenesis protein CysK/CcmF [Acidomonas methanolica NBRC 104435]GEK98667.1 c-type cytochrome biogenesis protein CcmF [Acidomonas methanolica NBRC 104435]